MKTLILTFTLLISLFSFSQDNYRFKIVGVTDSSQAKTPIDLMRNKLLISPEFNDSTDTFTVPAHQFLTEDEFNYRLSYYGYVISDFTKPKNTDRLEQK